MPKLTRKLMTAGVFALLFAGSFAAAQAPRILRGTIDKVNAATITIKTSSGADVNVRILDNAKVFGVKAATLADIKQGDWIGVGAMPQPDGSQKAMQVTIFSEAQRGVGAGFRPWTKPGSTMTNGTAGNPVASVNGQVVMVAYKGGEQKVIIGPDAKIRRYVAGTRQQLKPGTHVSVYNPAKAPDGTLRTARVNFGIGDMMP
ncbi:MAG: hypothetical protein ACRECE_10540 [Xanthobacteraceae bacterium]